MELRITSIKCTWLCLLLILLTQCFYTATAQTERTITGIVTDEKEQPAIGITVTVKGTKKAVITGEDGTFSIAAK